MTEVMEKEASQVGQWGGLSLHRRQPGWGAGCYRLTSASRRDVGAQARFPEDRGGPPLGHPRARGHRAARAKGSRVPGLRTLQLDKQAEGPPRARRGSPSRLLAQEPRTIGDSREEGAGPAQPLPWHHLPSSGGVSLCSPPGRPLIPTAPPLHRPPSSPPQRPLHQRWSPTADPPVPPTC